MLVQDHLEQGQKSASTGFYSRKIRIVDLWNGPPVAIRTIDQLSWFTKKVNHFILVNLS